MPPPHAWSKVYSSSPACDAHDMHVNWQRHLRSHRRPLTLLQCPGHPKERPTPIRFTQTLLLKTSQQQLQHTTLWHTSLQQQGGYSSQRSPKDGCYFNCTAPSSLSSRPVMTPAGIALHGLSVFPCQPYVYRRMIGMCGAAAIARHQHESGCTL